MVVVVIVIVVEVAAPPPPVLVEMVVVFVAETPIVAVVEGGEGAGCRLGEAASVP